MCRPPSLERIITAMLRLRVQSGGEAAGGPNAGRSGDLISLPTSELNLSRADHD
jgi:hypothetical protein